MIWILDREKQELNLESYVVWWENKGLQRDVGLGPDLSTYWHSLNPSGPPLAPM